MKLRLRHHVPAAVGAVVLLTGGTGAAAYALVGQVTASPTDAGNNQPIDDNHVSPAPTHSPEPADDRGVHATPEPSEDRGVHATPEPADDRGVHATPEPTEDRGGAGVGGHGSDDATPEPSETSHSGDSSDSGSGSRGGGSDDPTAAASPDDHGGGGHH
jgi:hypothetical protein